MGSRELRLRYLTGTTLFLNNRKIVSFQSEKMLREGLLRLLAGNSDGEHRSFSDCAFNPN